MNLRYVFFQVDQPDLGLSQKFLLNGMEDTNVKAYHELMVDAAVVFGANRSAAELELLESLQFEMELAKVKIKIVFFTI